MTFLYKRKCMKCNQFRFFKAQWGACINCYEKRFGKYEGKDRPSYIKQTKLTPPKGSLRKAA